MNAKQVLGAAKKYVDETLKGAGAIKGNDGKSAYQNAVEGGYVGTEKDFGIDLDNVASVSELYNHYAEISISDSSSTFEYEFNKDGMIKIVGGVAAGKTVWFKSITLPKGKYIIFYRSKETNAFFSGGDIKCNIKRKSETKATTYNKTTIPTLIEDGKYEIHYKNVDAPYYEYFIFESDEEFVFQLGLYENTNFKNGDKINIGLIPFNIFTGDMRITNKCLIEAFVVTKNDEEEVSEGALYVSSSIGDDSNDGKTELTPKKTIPDVINDNIVYLKAGDTFHRKKTIEMKSNSVLTTYGGTTKAIISGEVTTDDTLSLYSDGYYIVETTEFADCGYIRFDENNAKNNWHRRNETLVTFDSAGNITSNPLEDDLDWLALKYTENDIEKYAIIIKSSTNISGKKVIYQSNCHGISMNTKMNVEVENLDLSNIEITGFARHGVSSTVVHNSRISNLYVHDIGGAWLSYGQERYGNGIQLWCAGNKHVRVDNCRITRCYDTAFSPQVNASTVTNIDTNSEDILVENCHFSDSTWLLEFFGAKTRDLTVDGYKIDGCTFRNIFLENAIDITDGRRFASSASANNVKNSSLIQLWDTDNTPRNVDNIVFDNVIGIGTDTCVFGAKGSKIQEGITFKNVKLVYDESKLVKINGVPVVIGVNSSSAIFTGDTPNGVTFVKSKMRSIDGSGFYNAFANFTIASTLDELENAE